MSDSVQPHRWQPTRLLCPWDSPGKNAGVGCNFPLQCMKVKSEREVAQSCRLLATPWTTAHQAPPSMGFSRQEHWSGVPSPSPMHESEREVPQSCPTLRDPMDCSLPGSSVHGIFPDNKNCHSFAIPRVNYINSLTPPPQPPPAPGITNVLSDSMRPHRRQPARLRRPWDSPGKHAGVRCHFLLQCMKVKSKSEVAQSCLTRSDPVD